MDFRGTHGFGWGQMEGTDFGDDPMIHDVEDGIRHATAEAPVVWVRFPWEQHGLGTPANAAALAVVRGRFLGGCLGGPAWGFPADFHHAELEVRARVALVPGLSDRVRQGP